MSIKIFAGFFQKRFLGSFWIFSGLIRGRSEFFRGLKGLFLYYFKGESSGFPRDFLVILVFNFTRNMSFCIFFKLSVFFKMFLWPFEIFPRNPRIFSGLLEMLRALVFGIFWYLFRTFRISRDFFEFFVFYFSINSGVFWDLIRFAVFQNVFQTLSEYHGTFSRTFRIFRNNKIIFWNLFGFSRIFFSQILGIFTLYFLGIFRVRSEFCSRPWEILCVLIFGLLLNFSGIFREHSGFSRQFIRGFISGLSEFFAIILGMFWDFSNFFQDHSEPFRNHSGLLVLFGILCVLFSVIFRDFSKFFI